MGQFGDAISAMDVSAIAVSTMDVSAMKREMCFTLECHKSAKVRTAVVWEACKRKSQSSTVVPNLFLTIYPFSIPTNEHVPLQHFNR